MTDIGRVGMVTKGDYNSASTYEVLDVLSYNGGLYIAKQNVPAGTTPTNTTYWQTCAAAVKKIVRSIATDSASGIFYLSQSDYHNIINVFVADNSSGAYNNMIFISYVPSQSLYFCFVKDQATLAPVYNATMDVCIMYCD